MNIDFLVFLVRQWLEPRILEGGRLRIVRNINNQWAVRLQGTDTATQPSVQIERDKGGALKLESIREMIEVDVEILLAFQGAADGFTRKL